MHTVKGFGIVNKAEINVFLELSCFFYDPADVGNLISGSSAFSKTSLNMYLGGMKSNMTIFKKQNKTVWFSFYVFKLHYSHSAKKKKVHICEWEVEFF